MFKENLIKKALIYFAIFSASLLVAASSLPPLPGLEEPDAKIETEESEEETQPGINPLNDDNVDEVVRK